MILYVRKHLSSISFITSLRLGIWKSGLPRAESQLREIFTSPKGEEAISKVGGDSSGMVASLQLVPLSLDEAKIQSPPFPSAKRWDAVISGPSWFSTESFPNEEPPLLDGSISNTNQLEEHELQL
jgi:hypothetical protein